MSLRQRHINQQQKFNPPAQLLNDASGKEDKTILNVALLKQIINDELTDRKTDIDPEILKNYRKKSRNQPWRLRHMLDRVNKPKFIFMIDSFVENHIKEISIIQSNGKWEVYDFEISIEPQKKQKYRETGKKNEFGEPEMEAFVKVEDFIHVTVEYVDIRGGSDMIYKDGKNTGSTKRELGIPEDADPQSYRHDLVQPSQEDQDIIAKQAKELEEVKVQHLVEQREAELLRLKEKDELEKRLAAQDAKFNQMMALLEAQNEASIAEVAKPSKKTTKK
tara:strand:+ start:660 stop:1490 length:831 start_codon:yes stop_codon:yes gene_type:complete